MGLWAQCAYFEPWVKKCVRLFTIYFETGVGYGAINTARCALSIVLPRFEGKTIGEYYLVKWFCKSCYKQRPPQPRYADFWPVNKVLLWVEKLGYNAQLSLKLLSFKVVILLSVTSQRGQTILNLEIDRMLYSKEKITFKLRQLLKDYI